MPEDYGEKEMNIGACFYCGGGPLTTDHKCLQMRLAEENKMTLREQVARKMGWEQIVWTKGLNYIDNGDWIHPDKTERLEELPNWDESWEVCAKYVVAFMRERELAYGIRFGIFYWHCLIDGEDKAKTKIHNDDLAKAACEAFMEVEL